MKEADFLSGCKSGIQKGIRRGNLDLVKSCFEALWDSSKTDRLWLTWRLPILVEEEALWLLGDLVEFLEQYPIADAKEDSDGAKKKWLGYYCKLAMATKNKDSRAVWALSMLPEYAYQKEELNLMAEWRRSLLKVDPEKADPPSIIDVMHEEIGSLRRLSAYEKKVLEHLHKRAYGGGMLADKQGCMSAMVLVVTRGLHRATVKGRLQKDLRRYKEEIGRAPRIINLPVYCWDSHTQAGKMALHILMKQGKKEYPDLEWQALRKVWLHMGSFFVPKSLTTGLGVEKADDATLVDQIWWDEWRIEALRLWNISLSDAEMLWSKMLPDLEDIVGWCLEKRAGDED